MFEIKFLIREAERLALFGKFNLRAAEVNHKIIKLDNKNVAALCRLAKCYENSNNYIEASNYYKNALEIDRENRVALNGLKRTEVKINKKIPAHKAERNSKIIEKIVKEREIKFLCHFTHLDNIDGILKHGLLSVEKMKRSNYSYRSNDSKRLDNSCNAISCSISFPNYKMFYKYRNQDRIGDTRWIVLKLSPSILWSYQCIFCETNAASNSIQTVLDKKKLNDVNDFRRMFEDTSSGQSRDVLDIPCEYPTDPQAEVLVLNDINKKNIISIVVENSQTLLELKRKYRKIDFEVDQSLFSYRKDYPYWRK